MTPARGLRHLQFLVSTHKGCYPSALFALGLRGPRCVQSHGAVEKMLGAHAPTWRHRAEAHPAQLADWRRGRSVAKSAPCPSCWVVTRRLQRQPHAALQLGLLKAWTGTPPALHRRLDRSRGLQSPAGHVVCRWSGCSVACPPTEGALESIARSKCTAVVTFRHWRLQLPPRVVLQAPQAPSAQGSWSRQ